MPKIELFAEFLNEKAPVLAEIFVILNLEPVVVANFGILPYAVD
jgi:hypothetical protein